jgi:hypothetical protein
MIEMNIFTVRGYDVPWLLQSRPSNVLTVVAGSLYNDFSA